MGTGRLGARGEAECRDGGFDESDGVCIGIGCALPNSASAGAAWFPQNWGIRGPSSCRAWLVPCGQAVGMDGVYAEGSTEAHDELWSDAPRGASGRYLTESAAGD
jgi:hypothetical protein